MQLPHLLGIEGLDDPQTVVLDSSTVFSNTATNGSNVWGAGLRTSAALIVGGIGGADCTDGSVDAAGYTFTDDAACAGAATDVVSSDDPLLGPLADNGGGTLTHLPAEDSPIGGVVPAASCTQPVDQRGVSRPQGAGCEPGSVEIVEEPPAPPMNIIDGTPLSDLLIGTDAPDRISGLASTDLLLGLGGDDELYGGDGADLIGGGAGDDLLEGGPGGDLLVGEAGADELRGGAGNDFLVGDASDTFDGGPGLDICIRPGAITLC